MRVRHRTAKPEPIVALAAKVWARLEGHGPVNYIGPRHIAGYCPLCADVLGVRFIPGDPPKVRARCHGGCDALPVCRELLA